MYINYCNDPVLEEKQENQSSINNTDLDLGALDITSELYTSEEQEEDYNEDSEDPIARLPTREEYNSRHALAATTIEEEPYTYKEAISLPDKNKWIEAMQKEINSLEENNTWSIIDRSKATSTPLKGR